MTEHQKHKASIADYRIIALWALAETGLGGILHAFKIPLTGYLVGGMAVLCIGLLASDRTCSKADKSRRILKATLVVCALKALISPHAPPMAYIAVGFQGLLGAFVFRMMPFHVLSSVLFAVPALLESGVQKLLVMTLIYGMNLWRALDLFGNSVLKSWNIEQAGSLSALIIYAYLGTFLLAGIICARIMYLLPSVLEKRREKIVFWLKNHSPEETLVLQHKKRKHYFLLTAITIVLMAASFWMFGSHFKGYELVLLILRPVLIILILLFIFRPVAKYFLHRWLKKTGSRHAEQMDQSLEFMAFLKHYSIPLMKSISKEHKGWKKYPEWLFSLIALALYAPDTDLL